MINIKRKHILCEKHDISHGKKTECKILIIIMILQITLKKKYILNLEMI